MSVMSCPASRFVNSYKVLYKDFCRNMIYPGINLDIFLGMFSAYIGIIDYKNPFSDLFETIPFPSFQVIDLGHSENMFI